MTSALSGLLLRLGSVSGAGWEGHRESRTRRLLPPPCKSQAVFPPPTKRRVPSASSVHSSSPQCEISLGEKAFFPLRSSLSPHGKFFGGVSLGCEAVPGGGEMLWGPGSDCGVSPGPMEYVSTRGGAGAVDFEGALFSGYAPDGGLFMPQHIPSVDGDTLRRWSCLSYRELVKELCSLFITSELVPRSTLNGEPQPCRELLAGMFTRILGPSYASACLRPILFAGPRG